MCCDRTVTFAIDETTGEFSLNPNQFNDLAEGESETITVNYEVSDNTEMVANTASFIVNGANDVPMVETEIEDQTINDTDAFSLDVGGNFSDVDATDILSFFANGLPDGLGINETTGIITGTASGGGIYNITITAENLELTSVSDTFEMTVQGVITGTAGGDRLGANPDPNQIDGGAGNDNISGFASNDHLIGGEGDDYLKGGTENDLLEGGAGRNRLLGSKGMDTLSGGADNDLLKGGTQDDMLMGDGGLDRLYGNQGSDTFVLQADMGLDTIHDYKPGEDILMLEDGFTGTLGLTESGRNTMINIVDGEDETAIALWSCPAIAFGQTSPKKEQFDLIELQRIRQNRAEVLSEPKSKPKFESEHLLCQASTGTPPQTEQRNIRRIPRSNSSCPPPAPAAKKRSSSRYFEPRIADDKRLNPTTTTIPINDNTYISHRTKWEVFGNPVFGENIEQDFGFGGILKLSSQVIEGHSPDNIYSTDQTDYYLQLNRVRNRRSISTNQFAIEKLLGLETQNEPDR